MSQVYNNHRITVFETLQKRKYPALFVILLAGAAAFLPLIGQIGFIRDDWHMIWAASANGLPAVIAEFSIDRPFMGLIYGLTYLLLGKSPLAWNLYAFLIRYLSAAGMYLLADTLWPSQKTRNFWVALLFLLYPGFLQQPNGNTFQNHFTGYSAAIFSIVFTLFAIKSHRRVQTVFYTAMAVLLEAFYLLIYEYMIGLELARVLLAGCLLAQNDSLRPITKNLKQNIVRWLPYGTVMGVFLVWRLLVFRSARSVTDVSNLGRMFLADPLGRLLHIVLGTLKDLIEAGFLAWGTPLYLLIDRARDLDFLISLGIAAVTILVIAWFVRKSGSRELPEEPPAVERWSRQVILLGALITLFAILPVVVANRHIQFTDTFDRYTLHTTMGIALFVTGLVYHLPSARLRIAVFSFLVAVSMITHYNNAAIIRQFWNYQRQLWWQLSWRAPDVKDGTVLLPLLPPGYRLAEGYEVWAPANLIYRPASADVDISGEILNNQTVVYETGQLNIGRTMRKIEYKIDYKNSLVMDIPAAGSCLHVVDGEKPEYSMDDDALIRLAGNYSHLSMIETGAPSHPPPEEIFGLEPKHNWCYYYQKASLARQRQDWKEIGRLGDEAAAQGMEPQDLSEWLPFYEGYVHLWNYEAADRIAGLLRSDNFFIVDYCRQFKDFEPDPNAEDQAESFAVENLCGQLKE